ncbi:hypothetical protein CB1_000994012 [Camelus ferus]|nr:hypothetical protein CB1_000994012 [Camelus ferus]
MLYSYQKYVASAKRKKSRIPPPPILLSRTYCSVALKPAPFVSDVKVSWYCILGCKAEGSYGKVRLNNNHLPNSGEAIPADGKSIFEVKGLETNEKYVFAIAAYSSNGKLVGDAVGESTKPILVYPPLSAVTARMLLTQVAYQIGNYELAKKVFSPVWDYFVASPLQDDQSVICLSNIMTIMQRRLHSDILAETSSILLYLFLRNIFVTSDIKIKEENLFCDNIKGNEIFPSQQVARLIECERVLVALEISNYLNDSSYSLQAVTQCYGLLAPMIYHNIVLVPVVQVLAHRGGYWTLLQNCCRALWNFTQELQILQKQAVDLYKMFPISQDGFLCISVLPFYLGAELLIDMLIELQSVNSIKIIEEKGEFSVPSCYGNIKYDNGGSSLTFEHPLDDVNVVDLKWIHDFVLKSLELLYQVEKWETLVSLAIQFNTISHERYTEQVTPLLVYAQRQLLLRISKLKGPDTTQQPCVRYETEYDQKGLLRTTLPHPKAERCYAQYEITQLLPGIELFSDRYRADICSVVASLYYIIRELHFAKQNLISVLLTEAEDRLNSLISEMEPPGHKNLSQCSAGELEIVVEARLQLAAVALQRHRAAYSMEEKLEVFHGATKLYHVDWDIPICFHFIHQVLGLIRFQTSYLIFLEVRIWASD